MPMSSRDEILSHLRKQAREVDPPGAWSSRRHFAAPAERFVVTLNANKGEAHRARSLEEALSRVGDLLHEINAKKVIADDHPLLESADLPGRWPDIEWFIVGQSQGGLRDFASVADAGLSVATAAMAETGTVVLATGPGRSRLTGLLPPVHVVLAPTTGLSTDLFTWTALRPAPAKRTKL